ncbi:hypothetical protein B0H14DRAFT_3424137 [Mycena olivaceomarginata]|nr:hypothetical protein B0H14DRAFT_3424137 [Mycena olivaceomarginata]
MLPASLKLPLDRRQAASSSASHATSASTTCNSIHASTSGRRSATRFLGCWVKTRARTLEYASVNASAKPSAGRGPHDGPIWAPDHRLAHVIGHRRVVLPAVCVCDYAPAYEVRVPSSTSGSSNGHGGDLRLARRRDLAFGWKACWASSCRSVALPPYNRKLTSSLDLLPASRTAPAGATLDVYTSISSPMRLL